MPLLFITLNNNNSALAYICVNCFLTINTYCDDLATRFKQNSPKIRASFPTIYVITCMNFKLYVNGGKLTSL